MKVLHLLQWNIKNIIQKLDKIKEQGFDTIQISPLQGTKENNMDFWVLYQPTNFKIGNPQIGNKEDLINLCEKANKIGIKVIVDVVFRHTANDNIDWLKPNECIDSELKREDFFLKVDNITNFQDRWQCVNLANNLPLLNYRHKEVQDIQIRYLSELKECGVSGFRIDMAKHFALPCEGCNYFERVFFPFNDLIIYGEVLDASREVVDIYSKIMLVATNCYGSNKDRIITWVESHDDHLTFGYTKKLTEDFINNEYVRLCTNYRNTLYYVRPFSNAWESETVKFANKIVI